MKVRIRSNKPGVAKSVHDILRALLGEVEFSEPNLDDNIGLDIYLKTEGGDCLLGQTEARAEGRSVKETVRENILICGEEANQQKRLVKLAAYRAVIRLFDLNPLPWGILTGIRPTKIVHRLLDINYSREQIEEHLVHGYSMSADKASELVRVAYNNRKYILSPVQAKKLVSLYIGIPFCPTRCAYCSFPAYPVRKYAALLEPFLDGLKKEIAGVGTVVKEKGLRVQTVYIGGGTPTTLNEKQLAELLESINDSFGRQGIEEITLEAGRPDTLTLEKLKISKGAGITRLSINPQSMNPLTLKAIGRMHSPEEIKAAFYMAREIGFNNINMDLIIGLPGETRRELEKTLKEINKLRPENITVHTMAVKRASEIKENIGNYALPGENEVNEMLKLTQGFAEEMGMEPYYLYRQKYMVGPMENKGYAIEGFDCIYNVQVIEERQTIIGLGAGAASKFVNPADWTLTSHYNPKDPGVYVERVGEIIQKKVGRL